MFFFSHLNFCQHRTQMKSLLKNINIYWLGATILAIWFLFIHSPPILIERKVLHDLPFLTHLIGAYSLYLACIFNTLFTPSTLNGKSRYLHVYMGRLSLIAGMIGFMYGLFCSWWPKNTLFKILILIILEFLVLNIVF